MTTQDYYDAGNAELQAATGSNYESSSTNHATIACAYYLRALVEILGTKPKKAERHTEGRDE